MKLLYVASGHPLQEADDCLMWDKLGYEWYSTGYYAKANGPGDLPKISSYYITDEFRKKLQLCSATSTDKSLASKNTAFAGHYIANQWYFTNEFLSDFDIVIFNHFVCNILKNFSLLQHYNICTILKTYGMHPPNDETKIALLRRGNHLYSVRNSPKEHKRTPFFGGCDAIIRGSVVKDEHEISGWTGNSTNIVTFASHFNFDSAIAQRRRNLYISIRNLLPDYNFKLYGSANENEPYCESGFVTHKDKIKILQDARVALITGTPYANNTYSMVESWIMGVPLVVFGKDMWLSDTYEADQLVQNCVNGFIANSPEEAAGYIKLLIKNKDVAQRMSIAGRKKAVSIYGREVLSNQWKVFLQESIRKFNTS